MVLLHYYLPPIVTISGRGGLIKGRLDECSGAFGWKGMVCFSLPLAMLLLHMTHENSMSAFFFYSSNHCTRSNSLPHHKKAGRSHAPKATLAAAQLICRCICSVIYGRPRQWIISERRCYGGCCDSNWALLYKLPSTSLPDACLHCIVYFIKVLFCF